MSNIRNTPWSTISEIQDLGDGTVEYLEEFNLKHPQCPIVMITGKGILLYQYSERRTASKEKFELLYGSLREIISEQQRTNSYG